MFEGFTDRARQVAESALDEALELGCDQAGPEHILLRLLAEGQGVAAAVLDLMGIPSESVRREVVDSGNSAGMVQFSKSAQAVFDLSRAEAAADGHDLVGTQHLLLGLILESGAAARILARHGATSDRIRTQIVAYVGRFGHGAGPEQSNRKTPAEADLESRIRDIRAARTAAIDTGDDETARRLRETEKGLLFERDALRRQSMGD